VTGHLASEVKAAEPLRSPARTYAKQQRGRRLDESLRANARRHRRTNMRGTKALSASLSSALTNPPTMRTACGGNVVDVLPTSAMRAKVSWQGLSSPLAHGLLDGNDCHIKQIIKARGMYMDGHSQLLQTSELGGQVLSAESSSAGRKLLMPASVNPPAMGSEATGGMSVRYCFSSTIKESLEKGAPGHGRPPARWAGRWHEPAHPGVGGDQKRQHEGRLCV